MANGELWKSEKFADYFLVGVSYGNDDEDLRTFLELLGIAKGAELAGIIEGVASTKGIPQNMLNKDNLSLIALSREDPITGEVEYVEVTLHALGEMTRLVEDSPFVYNNFVMFRPKEGYPKRIKEDLPKILRQFNTWSKWTTFRDLPEYRTAGYFHPKYFKDPNSPLYKERREIAEKAWKQSQLILYREQMRIRFEGDDDLAKIFGPIEDECSEC